MSWLSNLFKSAPVPAPIPVQKPAPKTEIVWEAPKMTLNWNDPQSKISKYFTVHEATFLPSWNTHHIPSDAEKENILRMAKAMDVVRDFFGTSITVHCWIRPKVANCPGNPNHGGDYNALVKGAKASPHIVGLGVDWHTTVSCDDARAKLLPKLAEFGLCMEDLPGSMWVHNDVLPPRGGTARFFKP